MAEEFKILLGVDLKEDSLNSIKNQLNALTDNTHRIRIDIDNSRLLKQIDHAKKELRGLSGTKNNGIPLNVNAKSLEQSFNRVADIIDEIKISFGSLSKGDNMKPLLSSINDISTALSEVSKQFKDLSSSFNGFNLNLSVGGSKNPIAANAAYGQKARTDTIPQLKAQSDYLQNLLGGQEKIISQFLKNMSQFNGVDMFAKVQQMFGDMEDSNLSKQMEAYRQYIDYMKQLAKINNVPLDKFNSNFSKSADELIDATKKIQTGEAETEESMQKLQKIFGGSGIDAEKLTQQLDSIVEKLEGIGKAIADLSSGISIDGLTQSFNDLSDTLERLISNFEHFKNNISANFSNISDANAQAAAEVKQQSDSSASTVVQNEKKKQEAIRQTQKLISDSAQKSIENVSSKRVGRYFEIDKSDSNAFEKEMRGLVNQWTNNKGNLVDLKIDTRTSYDKDAQKNIERLHQAQVTYNNELGETIKKTIAWRKIGTDIGSDGKENPVYGFAEVAGQYSKTLGQTSTQTDRFVKQQKQAVSNLTNQINQLNRAANDQNAARPIKDSDHLDAISSKYNEIISAIQKMADASSATFVDEQNNVKKLISEYKSLVSEYKNVENVSTKMKGTDFESGLKIANSDLEKLKADAKDYPQIAEAIRKLDDEIKQVGDTSSLNKFNDQLRVTRAELAKIKAEVAADNRGKKVGIKVSGLESKIEDLRKISPEIDKFEAEIDGAKVSVTSLLNELKQVNTQGDFSVVNAKFRAFTDAAKKSGIDIAKVVESIAEIKDAIKLGDLDKDSSNIDTKFDKIENKTEELEKSMTEYKAALQAVKDLQDSTDSDAIVNAWNAYNLALIKVNNQLKINKNEQDKVNESQKRAREAKVLESEKNTLLSDADAWLASHTAAAKQFGSEIIELKAKIEACDNAGDLKVLKNSLVDIKNRARIAGKDVMTLGDRLKKQFSQYGSYLSVSSMFSYAEQALRAMYNNVVEIDTAMTNLIKVTDETDATYNRFLLDAGKNAKELGRSFSSFVEQTANWAKMGFNIDESAELAKISSIYANVADVDDATAVSDIVTAMKAFNIEAADSITIIDQLNKLSNEFAVSAAGLGQGLSRAASTMAASGMDMEHTLALLTGIAEITQSPEEAGNFLKVAVARIQGMKGELEELGEEVDESVDSISKVQTQILNLTHGKVNIFDSSGNFRDYYDIMQDIAGIVDELESTERAQLYEILFGKNRMNQGAAMIQAFQSGQIGKALDAAQNSTGSAYAEQEKWMESLEAKLGRLEAAFQSLSQTVLSSDLLGMAIDFITGLVEALDLLIEKVGVLNTVVAGISIGKVLKNITSVSKAVGGLSSLGDATSLLSLAFPNLAKGIGVFTTTLSNGTKGVGLLKAAFSGLWTVIKAHPIIATVSAIALAVKIFDAIHVSAEEATEAMEESFEEYDTAKQKVADINTELETTEDRIRELQAKGGLTFVEQQELENLREATELLQIQADLAKREETQKAKEAAESAVYAYKKNFRYDISKDATDEYEYNADIFGNNAGLITDESNISAMIAGVRQFKELRDSVEVGSEDWEYYNGIIEETTNSIWEQTSILVGYKEKLEAIPTEELTQEQRDLLGVLDDTIEYIYKELDPAKWDQMQFDDIFNGEEFANAKKELINIAAANKTVGISVDDIIKKYPELVKAITEAGFEVQDLVGYINSEAGVVNIDGIIENVKTAYRETGVQNETTTDPIGEIAAFNAWINNLSDEEKEIVYTISCNPESAYYTLQEWQDAVSNYEPPEEAKISFSDLIKEEDFSNKVDTYIENFNKLQEASEAYANGELTNEDLLELIDLFPELAGRTDDLDVAIDELLATMDSDMVSYFNDQFGRLDTGKDCIQLQNFINTVLNLGETVGNTQFSIDIDTETKSMEDLFNAMDESVSSTGLTAESIEALKERYQDLEEYNPARLFEETTNGIRLNTTELGKLEKAYESQIKSGYDKELETLKEQYEGLSDEISNCTDATRLAELYAQQDDIVNQINDIATLASQYEGLTSAYHKWEEAQSNGSDRDMYEGIISGREELEEEMSRGWLDDASIAYLELLSGEDLSTKPIDEQIKAYERLYETIGDTGFNVWDFFTVNDDGKSTDKGVYNFFDAVYSEVGELAAWIDENGNYHFDFEAVGGDKVIAEALGISEEAVQILLRAAEDAGFEVNLESPLTEFADLKTSAEEANEALKELGATGHTFNFNTNDIESANEQIAIAEEMLGKFKNEDGTVNLGIEGAEEAQLVLTALIVQRQQLSTPVIMSVNINSEQAETELEKTIVALQNYQSNYNNLEINAAVGADTTEAETNIQTAIQEVDPEVLVQLGISEDNTEFWTALETIKNTPIDAGVNIPQEALDTVVATIKGITPEMMVTAGLNPELIENYQYDRVATVTYNYNKDEVDNWNFDRRANIYYNPVVTGTVPISNPTYSRTPVAIAKVNGTAYAQGTVGKSYKQGDWDTKDSGVALGGELGQEVVVRDGRFFTIGDNGAEFFKYERGDIIFNHKQSEELFKYGKVTSNGGRGKALNGGSAFVEGTAFEYGSYGNGGSRITISGSVKKTSKKGSSDSNADTADEFKETFDWIEIAIDRLERAISRLDTKANSTYRSWSSRNKNLKKEISKVGEEIDLQQRAYDRYMKQADSVGLDESWAKLVREGKVDISTITDEDLSNKISEYQEWVDKAYDARDAIVELQETESELYQQAFDHIVTQYDGFLSVIEHERNMLEEYISQSEASGYIVSTKYYDALINVEKANIEKLEKEKNALLASLEEAVNSGTIKPDSEAWYYYNAPLSGNRWRYSI